MGKLELAIQDYGKAREFLSEDMKYQPTFNRGICYRNLGTEFLDKSIQDLKAARDMRPEGMRDPSVHNNLGLSYFLKGRYESAINEY